MPVYPNLIRPRRPQSGFGLVELMVSIAIALVILAALVSLFVNASRNNREMATANSVIESGRFAIEVLENDIVHAGYWSTYVPDFDDQTSDAVPTSVPIAPPDPCLEYDPTEWVTGTPFMDGMLGIPVQVFDAATIVATSCDDADHDPQPVVDVGDLVPDTDILVVRHAETCAPGDVTGDGACEADSATNTELFIQAALCRGDLEAGLTHVFARTNPVADPFVLRRGNCTGPAVKRRFTSSVYYVRNFAAIPDDGIPTLVRSTFDLADGVLAHQPPVPLIEGVQALRFELGIDNRSVTGGVVDYTTAVDWEDDVSKERAVNRGDGVPDEYVRCTGATPCTAAQLLNVVSVKLYVLARSRDETRGYTDAKTYTLGTAGAVGPFDDPFKRHVYTTTVRLPNISGRRERP